MEALSKDQFLSWHREEFMPHVAKEEGYQRVVDRLWWTAVTVIFMGGATLSLFMWVLLQKNTQIENLQLETQRIAIVQVGVMKTLEAHIVTSTALMERQGQETSMLTQQLIEVIKRQGTRR